MDIDDINRAFSMGRIDDRMRRYLADCLSRAAKVAEAGSAVHDILRRIRIPASDRLLPEAEACRDSLPFPGSQHRPGIRSVFQQLHRGAIRTTADAPEFTQADPQLQMLSLVRSHTQLPLAGAIRQIWPAMEPFLNESCLLIPRDRAELVTPPGADHAVWRGWTVTRLPLDIRFAQLFGARSADQVLALLRRAIERMGQLFVDQFLATEQGRSDELLRADELLRVLRGTSVQAVLCNGFTSGAADVINPLHCLVRHELSERGHAVATTHWQRRVTGQHLDFATSLAAFSLDCLAEIEHLLRRPASMETLAFIHCWSNIRPNIGGKGCPLDCNYDEELLTVRHVEDRQREATPIVDFRADRFPSSQLEQIGSRMLRLGCPSLGPVHCRFTTWMCKAYFQTVLPFLLEEHAS